MYCVCVNVYDHVFNATAFKTGSNSYLSTDDNLIEIHKSLQQFCFD